MLALIALVGLGARAYAVVEPVATPADDSHAYYALSKALYEEGSYGGPDLPRLQRLVAGGAAALRGRLLRNRRRPRRDGANRRGAARGRRDPRRLPARRAARRPPGGIDRGLRRRRLPPLHPLHRRADERAAGDPHPAGGGAGLSLGGRAEAIARLAAARAAVRPDRDVPARVPGGRRRLRRPRRGPGRRARGWQPGPGRGRRCSSPPCCCRSSPGRSATRSSSAAWCRSPPAAARPSTSAPSCPPTANTSGSRRCWSSATSTGTAARTPRPSNGSTRRRSSTASPPATRTCRATPPWARSASRTSLSTSAKTRSATWR